MREKIIGIKELHKNLKNISNQALGGASFVVIKNSKPVFKIVPLEDDNNFKKYHLNDLKNLQSNSEDKNLSKKIDNILY
jgi:antitoxin (DNA-binding transcriptional repressor) of toxin-antitoxin stability system